MVSSRSRPPQWSAQLTVNQIKTNPTVISINGQQDQDQHPWSAQVKAEPRRVKVNQPMVKLKTKPRWSAQSRPSPNPPKTNPTPPQCPPKSGPTNDQPHLANGQPKPWSTQDQPSQWSVRGQGQPRGQSLAKPSQGQLNQRSAKATPSQGDTEPTVKPRSTNGQAKSDQWSIQDQPLVKPGQTNSQAKANQWPVRSRITQSSTHDQPTVTKVKMNQPVVDTNPSHSRQRPKSPKGQPNTNQWSAVNQWSSLTKQWSVRSISTKQRSVRSISTNQGSVRSMPTNQS
ncbi:probable serine/threonine-protein kinase samkC isoform X2 [Pyrgilauda ruficollis]|uniref:probable serine/threonine-protein kinase samkC isoform X1 n=1 Tax=Pyrgilauda ruficollis TaxID=221976 RepID=UPI001B882A4F|nr:probable serine/threonine-protein kinase samkC isoform X1 [Pyrgilauda ruficollis]XP_041327457.1 probable serine/threonine-protein kinase samkC isoform X2 [Pyrgilauda ruficollis]